MHTINDFKNRNLGSMFYYSEHFVMHDKYCDEIEFIASALDIRDRNFVLSDIINQIIENQTVK